MEMNVVSKNANHCNGSKVSALSIACGSGSMEMVKLLVEEGAQVDYSDKIKFGIEDDNILTPLMCAAKNDHAEIIKYLVEEAGAKIEMQDKKRRTALFSSLEGTPDAEALKMLLKLGANPYVKTKTTPYVDDERGDTALHVAAIHNRSKMAEILLEKEPSLNDALNDDGKMPIHHAIMKGNLEVFRVLLKFNPDLDYRDHRHSMNLLHHAITDGVDVE